MADTLDNQSASFDSKADAEKSAISPVQPWLDAIELAGKQEKDWRKDAEEAEKVYESEPDAKGTAFNIYHANIETIVPAVYNSTPIPDVRRRFKNDDPVAAAGADILERCLTNAIDDYDFDGVMEDAVFDMVGPGRGVVRVRYHVETGPIGEDPQTGEIVEDVTYQAVTCEHVPWTSYRRGPARTRKDLPWEAFAQYYGKDALKQLSPDHGDKVPLDMQLDSEEGAEGDKPDKEILKRALVWEIWDKETRKVLFIAPSYKDAILAEVEDPLELEGFFSTPAPLQGIKVPGKLVPICEYKIYKKLIEELDSITNRIRKLIAQLKVKALHGGIKDADMERLVNADDGELVETADAIAFLANGGIDKLISWWPLDPTVKALTSLYTQREQVKQSIYEVTGISDIVRGQSDPNETLGAQEIKTQWGSMRVRRRQKAVQRFACDLLRLKAELIANKFTPQTLQAICGYQIAPEVMQLFKDDRLRGYKIDIETDSTIQGDFAHNQEQMSNFVQASGAFFQGVQPAVDSGYFSKEAAATIYQSFARNFNLGKQTEDTLDAMVEQVKAQEQAAAQQPPPEDPAMAKVRMEGEAKQAEIAMDREAHAEEMQFKREEHQQDMAFKQEQNAGKLQLQQANAQATLQMKREQGVMATGVKRDQMQMNDGLARDQMASDAEMQLQQESKEDMAVAQQLAELTAMVKQLIQQKQGGMPV